ncbi:MAG: LptF/LptG family permease [Thermodesulfobacteriota bacterium]
MNLLDRYIIKQFFWNLLMVLGGLLSLYLLIDFFEQIDRFTEKGQTIGFALRFFVMKIPTIYYQLSPVSILLAGIITLGILNHNHEAMALNAGGISLLRIISPVIFSSLLLTMMTVAMAQWLLPMSNAKTNKIWYTVIKQPVINGIMQSGRIFYRGSEGIYSFKLGKNNTSYNDLIYSAWDDSYTLTRFLTAQQGTYKESWNLKEGFEKSLSPEGTYEISSYAQKQVELKEGPEEFFAPVFRPEEHSLTFLWHKAVKERQEGIVTGVIDLYSRLSFMFLGVPLLIFAIPLTIHIHQRWGRDLTIAIPLSCCLAFVFWGIWSTLQSMAQTEALSPAVAAWSIHCSIAFIGLAWIFRMNQGR